MLSFTERLALLQLALKEHTPESLYKELSKYPAIGPSLLSPDELESLKEDDENAST